MPTGNPGSPTTTTDPTPASTIASAADATLWPGDAVTTGELMRSPTSVGLDVRGRERETVSMPSTLTVIDTLINLDL
jgi:hypothetical protein